MVVANVGIFFAVNAFIAFIPSSVTGIFIIIFPEILVWKYSASFTISLALSAIT